MASFYHIRKSASWRHRRAAKAQTPWDFRATAARALPRMVFDYIDGGAGEGSAVAENRRALDALRLMPVAPVDVSRIDTSVQLFGQRLAQPLLIAPTGLASAAWPRGEIALARAARTEGIPYVLPGATSVPPEEVAAEAPGALWFQLYPPPDREAMALWLRRIEGCGITTLEVTVDVALPGRRLRDARNGFVMPFRWTPRKVAAVAMRPAWAMKMLWHGQPTPCLQITGEDLPRHTSRTQSDLRAHRYTRALSWDLLARLRDSWSGRLLVKGLVVPRQAPQAVGIGLDGIVVSNHGGRQLDGAVPPIEVLPEFREAVGPDYPLILDSGIRSGADVLRALASGATAVQIGRASVFALATAGEIGVTRALALFREELEIAMGLCGATSVAELGPHLIRRRG